MKCPNCGTPVDATDSYCSFCGARMPSGPVATQQPRAQRASSQNSDPNRHHRGLPGRAATTSNKNMRALVLSIVGIIAAIVLAAGIFGYINRSNEESLWEECVTGKQIDDLRTYIEKFPDGEHCDEAKAMLDKLVMEKEAWEQARGSNDEEHLRDFIRNHSTSEYLDEARTILDDIVWNKALARNSKDAYEQYIKEFPDGKHIGDARSHFDEKRRAELSDSERDNVRGTLQNFLLGLENWDENLMLSTCSAELSSFMGKTPATLNDVREYYEAYRESIDSIGFSAPSVAVNKVIRNDRTVEYKVSFTTVRHMRRDDDEQEMVATMSGQAVLDDRFRFKELTMDKKGE